MPPKPSQPAGTTPRPATIALIAINASILWIWFVSTAKLHEMLVGLFVVLLSTLFAVKLLHSEDLGLNLRAVDFIQLWRIPWYIAMETVGVVWILCKYLLGERAGSYHRFCGIRSSKHDPVSKAQGVLVTVYASTAPNCIVIGIDPSQSHILFHQLKRSDIPAMMKNLGVKR